MSQSLHGLRTAGELLRRNLSCVPGVLIGSAIATPAFAATDIALDELRLPLLVASGVLLVIAVALRLMRGRTAPTAPPVVRNDFGDGIGRYRLQFGRGNAD